MTHKAGQASVLLRAYLYYHACEILSQDVLRPALVILSHCIQLSSVCFLLFLPSQPLSLGLELESRFWGRYNNWLLP